MRPRAAPSADIDAPREAPETRGHGVRKPSHRNAPRRVKHWNLAATARGHPGIDTAAPPHRLL
jgi:hypothetical protein